MKKISIFAILAGVFSLSCSKKELSKEVNATKESETPTSKFEVIDTFKEADKLVADENHPDAKTIKHMVEAGSNLSKLHYPDFQFDFKDLEDARKVASILQDKGFESKIYKPEEGFTTCELISKKMFLEVGTVIKSNNLS